MVDVLYVDAGNTRIKWRYNDRSIVSGDIHALMVDAERLKPKSIVLASVASSHILEALRELSVGSLHLVNVEQGFRGLTIAYEESSALGVDRWLNMLGALRLSDADAHVVVSCGTAVTIDVVEQGCHKGGYILPGLTLQAQALNQHTAKLPLVRTDDMITTGLANNTLSAIANGISDSTRALIEKVHRDVSLKQEASLILTGGDAETLSKSLITPFQIQEQLVFTGLFDYWQTQLARHET